MDERQQHWQGVYLAKPDAELSWFQGRPTVSLELIRSLPEVPHRAVDVGGGQSALAGELLDLGVDEVTVLDISGAALQRGRARLGARAARVTWLECDVLAAQGLGPFDLWHDRACFHFMVDAHDRKRYMRTMGAAVAPGGHAIIATFGPDGPEKCSGLPVQRWSCDTLAAQCAPAFELVHSVVETHATPWGKTQEFAYTVLRRRASR